MKILSKSGKKTIVLSEKEWHSIGEKAGWNQPHPLDRKSDSNFGIRVPEENYYRKVWASLVHILSNVEAVSEKDFKSYDGLMKRADSILRKPNVMKVVDAFEGTQKRADFCAETIFDKLGGPNGI